MYGGRVKELYTLQQTAETKANIFILVGQRYHAWSHRGLKSQVITMPIAKKKRKLGTALGTSAGWNLQNCMAYAAPAREFPHVPTSLFLFLVLEWALSLTHVVRKGYFLCFPFLCLYRCHCIQSSLCAADIAEVEAFSWRHWFERLSKVTAGICDYLMGLADYEKLCLLWGS